MLTKKNIVEERNIIIINLNKEGYSNEDISAITNRSISLIKTIIRKAQSLCQQNSTLKISSKKKTK